VLEVEQVLVVGVGVDGRHQPGRDTEGVVEDFTIGTKQFVVPRHGDDVVLSRVVGVFVDADHERGVDVGRRAEMMTFFAPALRCWPAPRAW